MNWLRRSAVFVGRGFLWLAHGTSYQSFYDDQTGETYYGIANKKEF